MVTGGTDSVVLEPVDSVDIGVILVADAVIRRWPIGEPTPFVTNVFNRGGLKGVKYSS